MSGFFIFSHMHASAEAAQAGGEARRARTGLDELEARLDKTELVCEALWTLMRDKLGIADEQLVNRINDIDLSDGKLDGKVRRSATPCAKCGRNVASRFARCMYCGQPMAKQPFA